MPRYQIWLSSGVELTISTKESLLLQALPNVITTTEGHQIRDDAVLALRLVPEASAPAAARPAPPARPRGPGGPA